MPSSSSSSWIPLAGPSRQTHLDLADQLTQRALVERRHDEIGIQELKVAGDAVRDGDAKQARILRRTDAVRGVLEGDRVRGSDAQATESFDIEVRRRLSVVHILGTDDGVESIAQCKPGEVPLDPRLFGTRSHGEQQPQPPGLVQQVSDSRERGLLRQEFVLTRETPKTKRFPIDRSAKMALHEVVGPGRVRGGAEEGRPFGRGDDEASLTIDLLPREAKRGLGVEDQAIKVKNQSANQPSPPLSSRLPRSALAPRE